MHLLWTCRFVVGPTTTSNLQQIETSGVWALQGWKCEKEVPVWNLVPSLHIFPFPFLLVFPSTLFVCLPCRSDLFPQIQVGPREHHELSQWQMISGTLGVESHDHTIVLLPKFSDNLMYVLWPIKVLCFLEKEVAMCFRGSQGSTGMAYHHTSSPYLLGGLIPTNLFFVAGASPEIAGGIMRSRESSWRNLKWHNGQAVV